MENQIESLTKTNELNGSCNSLNKQPFEQRSFQSLKPSLTGSYLVDDEIHKIIELIMRDFIDVWYKNEISSKDDFRLTIRTIIYSSIRYVNYW